MLVESTNRKKLPARENFHARTCTSVVAFYKMSSKLSRGQKNTKILLIAPTSKAFVCEVAFADPLCILPRHGRGRRKNHLHTRSINYPRKSSEVFFHSPHAFLSDFITAGLNCQEGVILRRASETRKFPRNVPDPHPKEAAVLPTGRVQLTCRALRSSQQRAANGSHPSFLPVEAVLMREVDCFARDSLASGPSPTP